MPDYDLLTPQAQLQFAASAQEIRACNDYSGRFGFVLNEAQIGELIASRAQALKASGRIEFGGGILPKLIYAFCDSPYLEQETYAETLAQLQEAFYYFKTESEEQFTDDELIEFMVKVFNGRAQGSAEYLIGTSLEALARFARGDFDPFDAEDYGDLF